MCDDYDVTTSVTQTEDEGACGTALPAKRKVKKKSFPGFVEGKINTLLIW